MAMMWVVRFYILSEPRVTVMTPPEEVLVSAKTMTPSWQTRAMMVVPLSMTPKGSNLSSIQIFLNKYRSCSYLVDMKLTYFTRSTPLPLRSYSQALQLTPLSYKPHLDIHLSHCYVLPSFQYKIALSHNKKLSFLVKSEIQELKKKYARFHLNAKSLAESGCKLNAQAFAGCFVQRPAQWINHYLAPRRTEYGASMSLGNVLDALEWCKGQGIDKELVGYLQQLYKNKVDAILNADADSKDFFEVEDRQGYEGYKVIEKEHDPLVELLKKDNPSAVTYRLRSFFQKLSQQVLNRNSDPTFHERPLKERIRKLSM